jgi:hypothetical protein
MGHAPALEALRMRAPSESLNESTLGTERPALPKLVRAELT